jgi:GAF domain-containing protein
VSATLWPAVTDPIRLAEVEDLESGLRQPGSTASISLDRLTCLAAELLEAPVSALTLVEADRQFFASSHGLPEPLRSRRQTPLEYSFCQHVVAEGAPLIVRNALKDHRVTANRAVSEFGIRSYAGMPIISPSRHTLGALSVVDYVPRDWTDDKLALLADLANVAAGALGLTVP